MRPLPPHLQRTLFTLSFGFAALVMATQNTFAQSTPQRADCANREAVLAALAQRYGEARRGIGIAGQGHVVEIFINSDTGTWTITATTPSGTMCLIASGSHFETLQSTAKGSPA